MATFQYHAEVLARYPDLAGGVILAEGMSNGPTPEGLREAYLKEQQATLARIGETLLSEVESLAAWRKAFRGFGVNPTKYRSAPEALLRRLTKKGDIPNINTLVDISNLVSIRYALPVATCDTRSLTGAVTVHFADGSERYTPLGQSEVAHPEPGEVVFSDETGLVMARRWCWRQSDESAARADTTAAIITLEAQHAGGRSAVEAAIEDMVGLLEEYAGGSFNWDLLGVGNPAI
jgi:DNA/RNA-binding domain of Phe-tRNA-synthetase-like protein